MSFRKRNVGISPDTVRLHPPGGPLLPKVTSQPGVRPSPVDGRPTTSTGTTCFDALLAGHAGQSLGTSILIGENGTTDYAGTLLRYYAAEGLVQGHHVHVVGVPEQWGRELPGLAGKVEDEVTRRISPGANGEKMKIAWRYEGLGQFGGRSLATPAQNEQVSGSTITFCHTFDLTKRLVHPAQSSIHFYQLDSRSDISPFTSALNSIASSLTTTSPETIHRLILPSLLSPALYPPHSSSPRHVLQFLHRMRALLATHQAQMVAIMSLPLSLYPRLFGLTRWIELLSDGVVEISPFAHSADNETSTSKTAVGTAEEPPQGLLTIHRLPVFHERGGNNTAGSDWAFTLSRRKFSIKPFSLPPIEGDTEAQNGASKERKGKKADMEF